MFKRIIWMGMGAAAGSAGTIWTQRKVRTQVDRVTQAATPQRIAEVARTRAVDVRDSVVAAVAEGRRAKADTENELRRSVDDRWGRRGDREPPRPSGPPGRVTPLRRSS